MKKNLMILAVAALAVFASCSDKKAARSVVGKDTTSVVGNTASDKNNLDLVRISVATMVIWSHSFALSQGNGANEPLFIF